MKIPSDALEAFLAVARLRKFAVAAKSLGLSQSALSQRILNLEDQLEATLFVRDRAGSRLTGEGENLLRFAQAQASLEAEFLGARQGADPLTGSLRVAAFSSVARSLVLPALAPLVREHGVRLSLVTRELAELPALLRRGEADLLLVDHEPAREGVEGSLLGFEENVLVTPRSRRSRNTREVFLDHDADDATTLRYFQKFGPRGHRFERCFLGDVYGLLDGVRSGLGAAVLPRHLVRGDRDLVVPEPAKVLRSPVWLHFAARSWAPLLERKAREALVAHAKRTLAP